MPMIPSFNKTWKRMQPDWDRLKTIFRSNPVVIQSLNDMMMEIESWMVEPKPVSAASDHNTKSMTTDPYDDTIEDPAMKMYLPPDQWMAMTNYEKARYKLHLCEEAITQEDFDEHYKAYAGFRDKCNEQEWNALEDKAQEIFDKMREGE